MSFLQPLILGKLPLTNHFNNTIFEFDIGNANERYVKIKVQVV